MVNMNDMLLRDTLIYEQLDYNSDTNTSFLLAPIEIKGSMIKGKMKTTTSQSGDSTTADIEYRTNIEIPEGSKLNGYTVMYSFKIGTFGKYTHYRNGCK